MRPWWTRMDSTVLQARFKNFQTEGIWNMVAKLPEGEQRGLILRQLCRITFWLAIIAGCSAVSTCRLLSLT